MSAARRFQPLTGTSDRDLIDRVLAGDRRAGDEFVDRYWRFIVAIVARGWPGQEEMLDEVPQKVIVHLWEDGFRRLRQWRGEGDFVSYLAPIVRHIAADHLRAQPGRREVSLDGDGDGRAGGPVSQSGDEGGETALLEEERRKAARTALASLRERDREILERYCIRGDTAETIARDLGLTAGAFYVALHRAKRRLYEKLLATYPGLFRDLSGWEVRKVATEPSGETNP